MDYCLLYSSLIISISLLFLRILYYVYDILKKRTVTITSHSTKELKFKIKIMIVMGSGGHTNEMLRLVEHLPDNYTPRIYVVADTDKMSIQKITNIELNRYLLKSQISTVTKNQPVSDLNNLKEDPNDTFKRGNNNKDQILASNQKLNNFESGYNDDIEAKILNIEYLICKIPRSREVSQSWISTVFTFMYSLCLSVPLIFDRSQRPDLLLCNGPGTCIPLCSLVLIGRLLFVLQTRIVFVESICRVLNLSMSGKILYPFADQFVVHWNKLHQKFKYSAYLGPIF